MSSHNQVLDLSARHQLIDLNKDKINFKVSFNVVSDPIGQEFQAIVMNQNDLNNYSKLDDIQMKTAPGKIGGTIVADNNVYQNYFLILKALQDQKVKVNINYEIEDVEPQLENANQASEILHSEGSETDDPVLSKMTTETPIYRRVWFWVIFTIGIGILAYMLYDYVKNRRDGYHHQIKKALANANYGESAAAPMVEAPVVTQTAPLHADQVLHDNMTKIVTQN